LTELQLVNVLQVIEKLQAVIYGSFDANPADARTMGWLK
jgi:hypothetical protein